MLDGSYLQLGAVGILGSAFLLIVKWMLNTQSQQLRDVSTATKTHSLVVLDVHKTMIRHDAQTRGVIPFDGEEATAEHVRAHGDYQQVLDTLESTAETIRQSMGVDVAAPQTRSIF